MDRFSQLGAAWTPLFFSSLVAGFAVVLLGPPGLVWLLAWVVEDQTDVDPDAAGLYAAAAWIGLVGCSWSAVFFADAIRRRQSDRNAADLIKLLAQRDVGKTVIDLRRCGTERPAIFPVSKRGFSADAVDPVQAAAGDMTTPGR